MKLGWMDYECIYKDKRYAIVKWDAVDNSIKIGKPDENGIVWDGFWVPFEDCEAVKGENNV